MSLKNLFVHGGGGHKLREMKDKKSSVNMESRANKNSNNNPKILIKFNELRKKQQNYDKSKFLSEKHVILPEVKNVNKSHNITTSFTVKMDTPQNSGSRGPSEEAHDYQMTTNGSYENLKVSLSNKMTPVLSVKRNSIKRFSINKSDKIPSRFYFQQKNQKRSS